MGISEVLNFRAVGRLHTVKLYAVRELNVFVKMSRFFSFTSENFSSGYNFFCVISDLDKSVGDSSM